MNPFTQTLVNVCQSEIGSHFQSISILDHTVIQMLMNTSKNARNHAIALHHPGLNKLINKQLELIR